MAVAWRLRDDGWRVDHSYPDGAAAPAPPEHLDGSTVRLSDGRDWAVDEISD